MKIYLKWGYAASVSGMGAAKTPRLYRFSLSVALLLFLVSHENFMYEKVNVSELSCIGRRRQHAYAD